MKKFLHYVTGSKARRMASQGSVPASTAGESGSTPVAWDREDHIRGCVYGHCTGDAIGLLTEFMNKQQAVQTYADCPHLEYEHKVGDFHRARWETGDWTDDSDQMILIIEMLLEKKEVQVDPVDYGQRLWNWALHGFEDLGDLGGMGIGSTTKKVLNHEKFSTDPHFAAEDIWQRTGCLIAPNGAVMRTSVLGVHQYQDLEAVIDRAKCVCKVTHADTRCIASCVAVVAAISLMLQRQDKHVLPSGAYNVEQITDDSYALAKTHLAGKHLKKHKKELKEHMYAKKLSVLKLDDKQSIGYTYKALGAGFWALRQPDFRAAIEELVLEGGDADSNGAVAGALLGCKLGAAALPPSWRDKLLHKDWLDDMLTRFLKLQENDEHSSEQEDEKTKPKQGDEKASPAATE